jgi:hypothetical protein
MDNFKGICDRIINENLSGKFITRNGRIYDVNSFTVTYTDKSRSIAMSYPIRIEALGTYTERGTVYSHSDSNFDIICFIPDDKQNNEELIDKFEEWLNKNFTDNIDGVCCVFDSFDAMIDNFNKTFKTKALWRFK